MATDIELVETKRGVQVGSLLIGVAIGVAVGGLTALFLAPRSGRETVEIIRGKAVETGQSIQSRVNDVRQRVSRSREAATPPIEEG